MSDSALAEKGKSGPACVLNTVKKKQRIVLTGRHVRTGVMADWNRNSAVIRCSRIGFMTRHSWLKSILLLAVVLACGVLLAAWKHSAMQDSQAASAHQPEPMEMVTAAVAKQLDYRPTTTSRRS